MEIRMTRVTKMTDYEKALGVAESIISYEYHRSMKHLRKMIKDDLIRLGLKDQIRNFKIIQDPNNPENVILLKNPYQK